MGYPTKIQLIKRTASEQWYINFPSAVAQAMEFEKGEIVEWTIEDKQRMTLKRSDSKLDYEKKTPEKSLTDELDELINECWSAFPNHESWKNARELLYGSLNCLGRHTITGILSASGNQFDDWSSAYRLFSKQRIDIPKIMNVIQSNVLKETSELPNIYAHMDDTIIKKTGRHVPGTAWRRDPLGPAFHTNFIWGQRFLQISMALPEKARLVNPEPYRLIFIIVQRFFAPKKTLDKHS